MLSRVPLLETPRLQLTPLSLSDAAAIQKIFPKWEIVEFLLGGVPWPYPEDGAVAYIRDVSLPAVERGEECAWSIRLRSDPEIFLGAISLFAKQDENRGYWLDPEHQRKGLMGEACEATNRFWFETLQRPILRELKAAANVGSRKLSDRQGMQLVWEGHRNFVSGCLPAQIWELTADRWRRCVRGEP
jgi:[ribosomal protein S5]-alanine N-acetyltransferase